MWTRLVAGLGLAGALLVAPIGVLAQTAPMMTVQRTQHYTLVLDIGPAMMSTDMDRGMAANHHVDVKITQGDSAMAVTDVTPTIRITDKVSGESRDLPQVMGMASMGAMDFQYGSDVFLPDGTYMVQVLVGPSDTATFRDVAVMASPMMMADHGMASDASMAMSHEMAMAPGTARDGRMFSQESGVTQGLFQLVWGDRAAQEWVNQHNAALPPG